MKLLHKSMLFRKHFSRL